MAAKILSAIYGLVMMAVLVGIMLQINDHGLLGPSSLFFFMVAGAMIIAGFLHPQEVRCLISGVVYYVTVPSMYFLLIIYAIFNLNDVSWGTREVATNNSEKVRHFCESLSQETVFKIWLSGSQEIVRVFYKEGLLQPTTTPFYEIKPFPIFPSYYLRPILILSPSYSRFSKWPFSFRFLPRNGTCISLLHVHDT